MADQEQKSPELEIKSDEDWKSRVKAEDAKLDAELQSKSSGESSESVDEVPSADEGTSTEESPPTIDSSQLPPPEFSTMVSMFSTQAMVALGIIPSPVDGKADQQLPLAKHFIDLLGVLDAKTKGNLSDAERSMLEQSLHELRMAYVELSRAK